MVKRFMCQPSSENQGKNLQAKGQWNLVITHLLNLLRLWQRHCAIKCDLAPMALHQSFEEVLLWGTWVCVTNGHTQWEPSTAYLWQLKVRVNSGQRNKSYVFTTLPWLFSWSVPRFGINVCFSNSWIAVHNKIKRAREGTLHYTVFGNLFL